MFIIKILTIQKFIIIYLKEIDIRLIDIKEKKKKEIWKKRKSHVILGDPTYV